MSRRGKYLCLETQSSSTSHFFAGQVQDNAGSFSHLPPEIRQYIYEELFGNQQVHVLYYNPGGIGKSLSGAEKMRKGKIPRWGHFICCSTPHKGPHDHDEYTHKWCHLSASLIFTCKKM
jgi:hypothetical protein